MEKSLVLQEGVPLWHLVDELCKVTQKKGDFDPAIHVPIAQEIVDSIDGSLIPSSYTQPDYNFFGEVTGKIGEYAERIGHYIVWKRNKFPIRNILILEPFWGRDQSYLFGRIEPYTEILYKRKNRQVESIDVIVYEQPKVLEIGFLKIHYYAHKKVNFWKNKSVL